MGRETPAVQVVEVAADEAGSRLDRWFKRRFPGLGHGKLEKLLRTGQVRVDGKRAKAGVRLAAGQRIRVPPLADEPAPARRTAPAPRIPAHATDDLVASVLSRMPAPMARALSLFFIDGKTQEEIAREEGLSVGAVKTRVHRAKAEFKRIYETLQAK